jgi:5-methylcytosine-specific restriction endonuclease McrA
MVMKACAKCSAPIEVHGNRRFCPPCSELHAREYSRKAAAKEREQNPELVRERQRRYSERHREQIRHSARARRADRADYIRAWRDDARFGGLGLTVLQRDDYQCRACAATANEGFRNLTVHHIDGTKDNNILENLITLCRRCHPQFHNHWHGAIRQEELRALIAS